MADENVYPLAELRKRVLRARTELRGAVSLLSSAAQARDFMFESGNYAPHEVDTEIQSRLDVIKPIVDAVAADFKTGTANSTPTDSINWDYAVNYRPNTPDVVDSVKVEVNVAVKSVITAINEAGISTTNSARAIDGFAVGDFVKISNATNPLHNTTRKVSSVETSLGVLTFTNILPGADQLIDSSLQMIKVSR